MLKSEGVWAPIVSLGGTYFFLEEGGEVWERKWEVALRVLGVINLIEPSVQGWRWGIKVDRVHGGAGVNLIARVSQSV